MKSLHEQMGGSYYLGKEHRIHQQIRKPNECQLQGGKDTFRRRIRGTLKSDNAQNRPPAYIQNQQKSKLEER